MPSLSLVTQSGAPNSSATATLVESKTGLGVGQTFTSEILQVQALPKLYYWFQATAGSSFSIQPQFSIRGSTIPGNVPNSFAPDPTFLDLVAGSINVGAAAAPSLLVYEFPAVYIRVKITNNGPVVGDFTSILGASV